MPRDVAIAGARRIRPRLGTQIALAVAFACLPASILFGLTSIRNESLLVGAPAVGLVGALWRIHAGIVVALGATRPIRLSARIVLRLGALGAAESLVGLAQLVLALIVVVRLDTHVHVDLSDLTFGALVVAALSSPLVAHVASRGWLGLVTARLVLAGERLPLALRESKVRLTGVRGLAVRSRAWASLPPVLLLMLAFGVARLLPQSELGIDLLAVSIAIPLGTLLNSACELELHDRLHRTAAEDLASVFR